MQPTPCSPDLSSPDFFLWGYLKGRIYTAKPRNITELKEAIEKEMRAITNSVCKNVMDKFVLRLKKMHGPKWRPSRTHAVEQRKKVKDPSVFA